MSYIAPAPIYRGHAASERAALGRSRRKRRTAGSGSAETELASWTLLGLAVGTVAIVAACLFAIMGQTGPQTQGSLISAVPTDAAFEVALRRTGDLLGPYQPATKAAEAGDADTWDAKFVHEAVAPSIASLRSVSPPVHLRESVEVVVGDLEKVQSAVASWQSCRAEDRECRTQRRALLDAVDDLYRTSGDLALYTFG